MFVESLKNELVPVLLLIFCDIVLFVEFLFSCLAAINLATYLAFSLTNITSLNQKISNSTQLGAILKINLMYLQENISSSQTKTVSKQTLRFFLLCGEPMANLLFWMNTLWPFAQMIPLPFIRSLSG
jgi:hypothetical protein